MSNIPSRLAENAVDGRSLTWNDSRIQEALVRYQQKRRLTTERMQVFARYLVYGGVEVGPKTFGGVTERELQEMDKENVYHARSQTDIGIDKLKLSIDFDLVVKGFL